MAPGTIPVPIHDALTRGVPLPSPTKALRFPKLPQSRGDASLIILARLAHLDQQVGELRMSIIKLQEKL